MSAITEEEGIISPISEENGKIVPRGLADLRLGTISYTHSCATCGGSDKECPGHFGHIELAKPVFHPGFLKKTKKLLEIVCHNCGRVKLDRVSSPT